MILRGSLPKASSFTIIAGLVFLISEPTVGSRLVAQTSPCFIEIIKINIMKSSQFHMSLVLLNQSVCTLR
jgi:hypothetical protein